MTTSVVNNSVLRGFFKKQKLTRPNFIDWYRQLRIVLSTEDKLDYLEQPIPHAPVPAYAGQQVAPEALAAHAAWVKRSKEIAGIMPMTMDSDIQRNLENLGAYEMLQELKTMFAQQAEQELLQTMREFQACKHEEGQFVSSYVLKMKSYIDNLEHLGYLISLGLGYEDDFINRFMNNTIQVSRNNMVYFSAILRDGIFEIYLSKSYANDSSMYAVSNKSAKLDLDSALLWHCRLGHINKKHIEKLQHDALLNSIDLRAFENCVLCMSGKMVRKPYTHQVKRAKDLLGIKHTDVCGPFKIISRQGASYFITFIDDFSRYGYVYLLKQKHEVFETFKVFQKEVENQLGKTIKSLHFDRGVEYMSQEFLDHLKDHEIIVHRTPPYTPQHNGVSERRNRTLLDMVRSMMSQTTLLKSFWDYALETTARILNMVPTKKVENTPYKVWHRQALKLSYLKVWGCEAPVKRDTLTKPDKLEPRSIKCIFVRYPKETMGYSFYYPPENKVFVARNAEFIENSLIDQEASGSLKDLEIIHEEDTHPSIDTSLHHEEDYIEMDEPQSDFIPIRRFTRTRHAPDRMCLYIDAEEHELGDLDEPANYKVALLDLESDKWLDAMNVEMQSMKDNEVWDLVKLPPDGKTVGSKWLFKKKTDMDGAVHTYKVRLVAKGCTQTYGVDYEETFSPVADIRATRILLAITTYYNYEI
uniref:Retrotransposon protein, putative, Ty1-copia subclass n=1 Tax=Tanacetum cinerariifolium TaxID=118510 RepID=A0A6L2KCV4_TANCI|nr:retrotransposon protein, putative, Ty1-copia subclass [Tanacetum cinerariifolium]